MTMNVLEEEQKNEGKKPFALVTETHQFPKT
jgi:hypothetical protein